MRYRRHGARLLGLLVVAALGAMALAASAQALTPGFLIGKAAVGALVATVEGKLEGVGTVLVPGLNFKINCTAFTVDEGKINTNTDAKIILLYTGCTTLSITKSPEEIACEVVEPVKAEALILPTELTNGQPALLKEAIKGLINLTKVGDLTKECILPFDNVVKGELCLKIRTLSDEIEGKKIETNDTVEPLIFSNDTIQKECRPLSKLEGTLANSVFGTHEEILKLEKEAIPKAFLDELKYGSQQITIDFAATLKLTGVHAGKTLGVSLY